MFGFSNVEGLVGEKVRDELAELAHRALGADHPRSKRPPWESF